MSRVSSIFWLVVVLACVACGVPELDLDGRKCPCLDGYQCDKPTNRCVSDALGDAATAGGIQLRAVWTAPKNERSTLPVAIPSSVVAGDYLFLVVFSRSGADATGLETWERITTNAGSCGGWRVYHYRTAFIDGMTAELTFSESSLITAALMAYSGVDPVAPIDAQSGVKLAFGPYYDPNGWSSPDITTFSANALLLAWYVDQDPEQWTAPDGMTKELDIGEVVAFDQLQAVPGPTGVKTPGGASNGCGTVSFWALAPE